MSIGVSFESGDFPPNYAPEGVKFSDRPHCGPSSGQIYAHTPIARSAFDRPLDPLKYFFHTWDSNP